MNKILFPRVQRMARNYLIEQLTAEGKPQHVGTKQPKTLTGSWVRLVSQGGPRRNFKWEPMLNIFVYADDEVVAEENANLVHSLMLDVPGVKITVPEYPEAYPWVHQTRHVSGPANLGDEDLPELEMYRIVVVWTILPIP